MKDWRYSLDARSISSGRSFASRVMSSSSVCLAFSEDLPRLSVRSFWNRLRSFLSRRPLRLGATRPASSQPDPRAACARAVLERHTTVSPSPGQVMPSRTVGARRAW